MKQQVQKDFEAIKEILKELYLVKYEGVGDSVHSRLMAESAGDLGSVTDYQYQAAWDQTPKSEFYVFLDEEYVCNKTKISPVELKSVLVLMAEEKILNVVDVPGSNALITEFIDRNEPINSRKYTLEIINGLKEEFPLKFINGNLLKGTQRLSKLTNPERRILTIIFFEDPGTTFSTLKLDQAIYKSQLNTTERLRKAIQRLNEKVEKEFGIKKFIDYNRYEVRCGKMANQ